jgi:hypothetical protein
MFGFVKTEDNSELIRSPFGFVQKNALEAAIEVTPGW